MHKSYWAILLGVILWVALVGCAIALIVWLTILWAYTPLVLLGVGFLLLISLIIWVDQ